MKLDDLVKKLVPLAEIVSSKAKDSSLIGNINVFVIVQTNDDIDVSTDVDTKIGIK